MKNTKVLPYEAVIKQHRLLVGDISGYAERTERKRKSSKDKSMEAEDTDRRTQ